MHAGWRSAQVSIIVTRRKRPGPDLLGLFRPHLEADQCLTYSVLSRSCKGWSSHLMDDIDGAAALVRFHQDASLQFRNPVDLPFPRPLPSWLRASARQGRTPSSFITSG